MNIKIRNFRGCRRADIAVSPIALIVGLNRAGKSSICKGAAAALTGYPIPYVKPGSDLEKPQFAVTKSQAGALVSDGTDKAQAEVSDGKNAWTRVFYPKGDVESQGKPPAASLIAAGLVNPAELDAKKLGALLTGLLDAAPSKVDLGKALADAELPSEWLDKLWEKIEVDGWDATHKNATEHRARLKGQWEGVTGEKYGSSKAQDWLPENWDDSLQRVSRETLEADVAKAREAAEKVIGAAAVSEDEIARLERTIADGAPDLGPLQKALDEATKALDKAEKERADLPAAGQESGFPCPHCGEKIAKVVSGPETRYVKAEKIGEEELKKRREAIAKADGRIGNAKTKHGEAMQAYRDAEHQAKIVANAEATLAEARGKDKSVEQVEKAREKVRVAEERLEMWDAWEKAARAHRSVQQNDVICGILDPKGLRRSKLVKALDGFNDEMAALCAAAKWKPVSVDTDMDISTGGRSYTFASESERFLAAMVLQVAIAKRDGSACVIIDGADIADKKYRNGVFQVLKASGVPAIVGMTLSNPASAPDLARFNMGATYVIDDGEAVALEERKEAA